MKPRLLFITQKIHQRDDDLAFSILWIRQFIRDGFDVQVICLEKGVFDDSFPVYSLGKESGLGRLGRILRFYKLIFTLQYDRVFVHMNPEYFTLGGWWWFLRGVPMYFWYTHYTMTSHLRLAGWYAKRMFAATSQSLPQYEGNPKKVVLGHGIDVDFWESGPSTQMRGSNTDLVSIHRLSRSKRVEIGIKALCSLPGYRLAVYGRDVDKGYAAELREAVRIEHLEDRVHFAGPVPMEELRNIYPRYRLMVNMASETIDKTMLEAMLFGLYPITTKGNSIAIGLPVYPENDEPETIAAFIKSNAWAPYDQEYLANIVKQKHSLPALIHKMGEYIRAGN